MTPKNKNKAGLLVFTVTAGLLIFLTIAGGINPLENFVSKIFFVPLLSAANGLFGNSGGDYQNVLEENRKLSEKAAGFDSLQKENETMRTALQLSGTEGRRVIPVSNVGFYRSMGNEIVIIDRGTESGVKIGDAVMTAEKIFVGRIISNNEGRADVLLATSQNQTLDVTFSGSGGRARARGMNGREFAIDFVPENSGVQNGDLFVVTKKIGDAASLLLLGEVRDVISDQSHVFKTIRAIHLFDPALAEPLFVITTGATR